MRRQQEGMGAQLWVGARAAPRAPPASPLSPLLLTSQLQEPASCCSSAPNLSPLPGAVGSWPRFVGEAVTRVQAGTEQPGAHGGAECCPAAGRGGTPGSARHGAGCEEDGSSQRGVPAEGLPEADNGGSSWAPPRG